MGGTASAHDRHGNVAMHQDVRVQFAQRSVNVTFALETNDEGRVIEAIAMDANGDGKLAPDEQAAYFVRLDAQLREGLQITIAGRDVPLSPSDGVELTPPARKTFHFSSGMMPSVHSTGSVEVHNDNFLDWPGRTALQLEAGDGLSLDLEQTSDTDARGLLFFGAIPPSKEARTPANAVTWSDWSWQKRVLQQGNLFAVVLCFGPVAFMLIAHRRLSRKLRIIGWTMAAACSAASAWPPLCSRTHPLPSDAWMQEFRNYHERLTTAIARYHQDGQYGALSPFGSETAMKHLADKTRVSDTNDEKSGVFELRRVRPLTSTMLNAEEGIFQTTIRVHHEWRAIGLMRHFGHPHDRMRDFACDYTLRVTDSGFRLLDCNEWHQLPDEPVE